jgi:hypothetical protein
MAHKPPAHQVAYDSGRGVAVCLNFGNVRLEEKRPEDAPGLFIHR